VGKKFCVLIGLFLLLLGSMVYAGESMPLNMPAGVTPVSRDIYELHMIIFWICVAIGVVVFGVMLYAIIFHRKSRGAKPAQFHSHLALEITWTLIPLAILVLMAIPATKVLIHMSNIDDEELTVKITGYQWKWHYEYLEDGISFFSNLSTPWSDIQNKGPKTADYIREVDNPLVLPIHKKVRFLITSNDVNHAWWVPDFGVKRDAIPGYINEGWARINKAGTYRGQCAELCGINHAYMPIVVVAKSEQDYKEWVAQQKGGNKQAEADVNKEWTLQELMQHGEKVYMRICAACHQPSGLGTPPVFPALKNSHVATGPIQKHADIVMNGVSGTAMQPFKAQLNDVDLAAVITYERNAFGNNTGTLVQPIEIRTVREGKLMSAAPASVAAAPASVAAAPASVAAAPASVVKTLQEQMQQGEKVYMNTCAVCHQPTGVGMPPTFPALKGSPMATGPVENHLKMVLFGKQGTAMQAFKDQLNDEDLSAVITFERNSWGNATGTIVQPADIQAARQQQSQSK